MNTESLLIDWIKDEEGFSEKAYIDTLGIPTFGYGFTSISRSEADMLLHNRINSARYDVDILIRRLGIELDDFRKCVLIDMCYQLGVNGLSKFRNMFEALRLGDYDKASDEMLDSKWHTQTPHRCELLARRMRVGY